MMSCYYPTTVIAIDDDKSFLTTMGQHLEIPEHNLYTSPELAMKDINIADPYERIKSRLLKFTNTIPTNSDASPDNYSITINPHKLHEEIYYSERFNDVSVIIIDYHMGDINGIDVCQQFASHPAKKILLTGGTDKEKIAIDAFNQGIIHRFINKSDKSFPTQLKQAITILKDNYFRDLTNKLIPHLPESNANILNNTAYVNFVKNLQLQLSVSEHYLLDISGSVVFIDADGSPTWLLVKNERELNEYEEIASGSDDADHILNAIKMRKCIPFFLSGNDFHQPVSDWSDYLYPSNPLPGNPGHFYSLVKGHVRNNLKAEKIITVNAFNSKKNTKIS